MLYEKERQEVINTGLSMMKDRLVVGTWGNISTRIRGKDLMAITPSGVSYENIEISDIAIMDLEGNLIDGDKKPSIEFPMHGEVYKRRSDVMAIVHTHSEFASAFALARKPIVAAAEDMAQIIGGDIEVSKYALPGSKELSYNVLEALKDKMGVVIANHGLICCGRNLKEALKAACIVEKCAKENVFAQLLGGIVPLSHDDIEYMRDFYLNKYGKQ